MLAVYLICLIVGGVFVGLSVLSSVGDDASHGLGDHEHDFAHDSGHHGGDGAHAIPTEGGSVAEAAHVGGTRHTWVPFTSFRFWTFGAFFFALTGLLLNEVAGVGEPIAALAGLGVGALGGTGAAALVRQLRRPIGLVANPAQWVGVTAELRSALAPGGLSKVRVRAGEKDRELLVTLADPKARALPKGSRVIILEIDRDGRARVAPETTIFGRNEQSERSERSERLKHTQNTKKEEEVES